VSGDTTGASNDSGCGVGPDVYYRFSVSARTIVYADTFGASWDTRLAIATGATGSTTCVDDACGVLQSQLTAVLAPGTYYLVVSGFGTASFGPYSLHVQSLPAGNGTVAALTSPSSGASVSGSTSGTGNIAPTTCGMFGSNAGESTYYWASCPAYAGGAVTFSFCASPGTATYDTVLYFRQGNGSAEACNDDFGGSCTALRSELSGTAASGALLHAVYVDGYNGATGSYTMRYTIP
jgi:hypothetical protein